MDSTVSIPLALMAGIVAFASPCFLPVVPAFVANVVGESRASAPVARKHALLASLVFVAGFTLVFVGIWVSIGIIGNVVGPYRSILRIGGGIVLVFMGLHVAEVVQIPFLNRATASQTVGEGALLLVAFSLGLGIPFALVALGATAVSAKLGWITRHHRAISIISGILIVATGLLMITNLFERLAALIPQFGL